MAAFDVEYRRFVENRRRLRVGATDLGLRVDEWIAAHPNPGASMREIAELQGLLMQRRRILFQIVELDDNFITVLLEARPLIEPS